MKPKIVMLVGEGESSRFMYNGLKDHFNIEKVIEEGPVDRKKFIKRRVKKLGLFNVLGQVLFQIMIPPILRKTSLKRINEIVTHHNLDGTDYPINRKINVSSVNSTECLEVLNKINPDLVIVNGTRIISKRILNSVDTTFINTHVGITPKYRGVHGGYWSLANDDKENCGVTVHKVDSGIDTGGVLYQALVQPTPKDNFVTYTYLQIAEGVKIMRKAIFDFENKTLSVRPPKTKESKLWYHPTIWFYLYKRFANGIK